MQRIHNFSAGPAALPDEVRFTIAEALSVPPDFEPSVMEISHRGPAFSDIAERLMAGLRRLTGLGDEHAICLLQGGAHLQFAMLPMNLAAGGRPAAYLDSGHWAGKAIAEARRIVPVHRAGSGRDNHYRALPAVDPGLPDDVAYLHYCGNETIHGLQFPEPPDAGGVPLAADLSSEIFCREYPFHRLGMAYAGTQKNLGISGLTLVIIRRDLLERIPDTLPGILDYRNWVDSDSLINTPPTLAWYVTLKVIEWIEQKGGLEAMGRRNRERAARLYAAIDASDFYDNPVEPDQRSIMNVPFLVPEAGLEPVFVRAAEQAGLPGLKGHRAVGGLRASLYNGLDDAAVDALLDFMADFEQRRG